MQLLFHSFLSGLFLFGFGASCYLSQLFYQSRAGLASFQAVCTWSNTWDCNRIVASQEAEIFGGIPLSSLAAGWFLWLFGVSLLFAWVRDPKRRSLVHMILLLGCCGGLLFGLPYLGVMAFKLKAYCLFCLLLDGIHFLGIGLLAWRPWKRPSFASFLPFPKFFGYGLFSALPLALFLLVGSFAQLKEPPLSRAELQNFSDSLWKTPVRLNELPVDLPLLGAPQAPLTVVKMSDFTCPHCKHAAQLLKHLLKRYPDELRVIFRAYPLSNECNPAISGRGHSFACEAAKVALCAQELGKFEPIYETLFEHQDFFSKKSPTQLGIEAGLPEKELLACLSSPRVHFLLDRDIQFGINQNIRATPSFWIQGRPVQPLPFEAWDWILSDFLKRGSSQ